MADAAQAPGKTPAVAPEQGQSILRRWLSLLPGLHPPDLQAHLDEAHRCIFRNEYTDALAAYERALVLRPDCLRAHQGVAILQLRKRQLRMTRLALGHIQSATELDPYDPLNYRIAAEVYLRLEMRRRVRAEQRNLAVVDTLRTHPDHPIANNQMGILLMHQFRVDLAEQHFARAIEADPRCEVALRNLARLRFIQADATSDPHRRAELLALASDQVNKALQIAPTAGAWVVLARIRLLAGHVRDALEAVAEAERLDPDCRDLAEVRFEARGAGQNQPDSLGGGSGHPAGAESVVLA